MKTKIVCILVFCATVALASVKSEYYRMSLERHKAAEVERIKIVLNKTVVASDWDFSSSNVVFSVNDGSKITNSIPRIITLLNDELDSELKTAK